MYLIKAVVDIFIVLLLLRLLIKPTEAYFNPIYRLLFRITDPFLTASRYISKSALTGILLSILALVVIRGVIYVGITKATLAVNLGISFYDLVRFLFQAYMVLWFVSLLAERRHETPFFNFIQRAFIPLNTISRRLGISHRQFSLFSFLFLLFAYTLLRTVIRYIIVEKFALSWFSVIQGLGEGVNMVLALFPVPGFFSLVIVIGALLSWVSPDPSNPLVQAIYGISEPLLRPFRKFVPLLGGLDLSPIVALVLFQIVGLHGQQIITKFLKLA